MNKNLILSLTVFIVACVFTSAPQTAFGNCENASMKLKVWKRGIKLTPAGGPKCLHVFDLPTVDTSFIIKLRPKGQVTLQDNDVTVTQVQSKTDGCGSHLTLGGDLTNTGENDMIITVKGTNVVDYEAVGLSVDKPVK